MIRVELPFHLRNLARVEGEVHLHLKDNPTIKDLIDALETQYPALRGTIRHHNTGKRRAYIRFFACQQDISHEPHDTPLPEPVANGAQPFLIIGAIAGG